MERILTSPKEEKETPEKIPAQILDVLPKSLSARKRVPYILKAIEYYQQAISAGKTTF